MIAEEVFRRVRNRDLSVVDLYAADGTVFRRGETFTGRDGLTAFYRYTMNERGAYPEVQKIFECPPLVAAHLSVGLATGNVIEVVDIFEIVDGQIKSLHISFEAE